MAPGPEPVTKHGSRCPRRGDERRHPPSLLIRVQQGDEEAWSDLAVLYRPLLMSWLQASGRAVGRRGRPDPGDPPGLGTVSPVVPALGPTGRIPLVDADHRRQPDSRLLEGEQAAHAGGRRRCDGALEQLADPASDLNRHWDEEHDRHVLRCLLVLVEQEFDARSVRAFRRLALDEATGADVAAELGISVAAAYQAKSRILQKIRQEAGGYSSSSRVRPDVRADAECGCLLAGSMLHV